MNVQLNKRYNFITIAPAILGASFTNMKAISIMTYKEALKKADITTTHKQVEKSLPQELRVTDLTYVLFEDMNGKELVMPLEYMVKDSLVPVTTLTILVELPDRNTEDIATLSLALTELGFFNAKITTKTL
jgi:hypothetical protein|nr:MAG TPA: hypothetical protein [Caudoviricetes sp.]DAO50743.1 MAG TPA: hypothetical protein [Caudoviricetes sp.]